MRSSSAIAFISVLFLRLAYSAGAQPNSPVQVTFDDSAVRQMIAFQESKHADADAVQKWMDLPANRYLLDVGIKEDKLTADQLKANVEAAAAGTATRQSQPPAEYGSVFIANTDRYQKALDLLEATTRDRIARISARDAAFCPSHTSVHETVYFHLGGDWDAINDNGNVYVNVRFWLEGAEANWDGLNMIIAHETMHTIQNSAYGNPEDQSGADGAYLTALSKIEREGIARYVEYDTDPEPYSTQSYGFVERGIDSETLRSFRHDLLLLQRLYDTCYPKFDHDIFVETFTDGDSAGGPYYDIGHGIAKAVDERLGRNALIESVRHGPKRFFLDYAKLTDRDSSLPSMPLDVRHQIERLPEKLPSVSP